MYDAARLSLEALDDQYNCQNLMLTGADRISYKDLLLMLKEIMNGEIEIELNNKVSGTHYQESPYSFNPKFAKKLVANSRVDLGQGIVQLLSDIHNKQHFNKASKISGSIANNELDLLII